VAKVKVSGFINIYRSGFFHTPGKAGAYDRHPGDIYKTEAAAVDDVSPASHYICTVPVSWEEDSEPHCNPERTYNPILRATRSF
jgi:hypothetical protein